MTDKSNSKVEKADLISKIRALDDAALISMIEKLNNFDAVKTEIMRVMTLEAVENLIKGDQSRIGNHREEHETFQSFIQGRDTEEFLLKKQLSEIVFSRWVKESPNTYAVAYRRGCVDEAQRIATKNQKRATKERRLIGAASRDKVRKSAQSFRHLSKELAAPIIAEAANLSPGTVRRYLSELFPGIEWKKL